MLRYPDGLATDVVTATRHYPSSLRTKYMSGHQPEGLITDP